MPRLILPVSSRFILTAITLLILLPVQASSQGYLHASGIYIADENNNQVLLRGMGLGGWLVPEGYMIGTSSFANSATAFKNVVAQLVGDANADQFFDTYRGKYVQRKDIDSLARWGFNSVRLPMHYGLLSSAPGAYSEPGFAIIDSLLSWCEANQIYLILDLHAAPGGQNKDNISDYQGPPSLWESATYQRWTAEIWKTLATRYATKRWIGGYDLLNETAWTFPSGNGPLRDLLVRITDSIRTVDRNHLIFAEGNWYATDFSGLTPAWDSNMAWSFHKYWNPNEFNAVSSYLSLRASSQRPLWLGESGENSNQWLSDCITMMESYNIGWSWWTLKKIEGITSPFSAKKAPGYDALLKYWSGQGAKPSVSDAMNALNTQASFLDADLCVLHPDVLNALFGVPTPNQRKPFADNAIPGVLYAVNYDMGKNALASFDVDYQNTQGNGGPAYNSGWSYRNDGVDIEPSTDPMSNGFDVGWTSAGEFLAFTVHVETAGTYNIILRASSGGSGGNVKILWDGGESPVKSIPATGGWQIWQSIDLGTYPLATGIHDFQVYCMTGGYNISRITFTLIASGVNLEPEIPNTFGLWQNYPNPFNPLTTIRYGIPRTSRVAMSIFNVLGQEVARPVDDRKEAVYHDVSFDGSRFPSGLYVVRLQGPGFDQTRKMLLVK